MSIIRWDPAHDLMTLRQAMDKLFEESVIRPPGFTFEMGAGNIPIDMYHTASEVVVKATLPGLKPEEVDVSISGNTLTIKAERKEEKETKEKDYIRKENRYGMVSRSITLPSEVKAENAEASFKNGILSLVLPKIEKEKPKQIKIHTTTEKSSS